MFRQNGPTTRAMVSKMGSPNLVSPKWGSPNLVSPKWAHGRPPGLASGPPDRQHQPPFGANPPSTDPRFLFSYNSINKYPVRPVHHSNDARRRETTDGEMVTGLYTPQSEKRLEPQQPLWMLGQRRGRPMPRGGHELKETEGTKTAGRYNRIY